MTTFEEQIVNDYMADTQGVAWEDIAGLELAKETLKNCVINPQLNPKIYTRLRAPPKGVLLFGPPGTGKTMLAKAIAKESGASAHDTCQL